MHNRVCKTIKFIINLQRLKNEFYFLKGNFLVLIISWVFFRFAARLRSPFDSLYYQVLGATPFIIGLMLSISRISTILTQLIGSFIADYFGRKRIISIMTFGVALSYVLFIIAPSWQFVLIGLIINGLCGGLYSPALAAITADSLPSSKRSMGYALVQVIPSIPAVIAPLIAGFILDHYGTNKGMRIVYSITLMCALSAAIVRLMFLKETLYIRKKKLQLKVLLRNSISDLANIWRKVSKSYTFLMLSSLVLMPFAITLESFVPLYVVEVLKLSKTAWGGLNTLNIILLIALGTIMGKVVDLIGRRHALVISCFLFIIGVITFLLARGILFLAISLIIFTLGSLFRSPAFLSLRADLIPREYRGRIFGTTNILQIIIAALSSVICGYLYDINKRLPMLISLLCVVFSLIFILKVKEPKVRYE